jgi:Domain of unknown function (DUF3805)
MRYSVFIIVIMFSAFTARLLAQEATYTSPRGFFTVSHPKNWIASRVENDDNIVNIAPPDATGAVTISAFHGDFTLEDLQQLMERTFKQYRVVSALQREKTDNSTGLVGEFLQIEGNEKRVWLTRTALRGHVMVFMTANDTDTAMKHRRRIYERILKSLVVRDSDSH